MGNQVITKPNYLLQIQFKGQEGYLIRSWDIVEEVQSPEAAQVFKSLIDYTVSKARIVEINANKIIEIWKG